MKTKTILFILLIFIMAILMSGCVPGDGSYSTDDPANFLSGIWHGWIAPLSLIIGLFKHNVRIYEVFNNGWWYDFGYYIAIIGGGFGGISLTRSHSNKKKNK